MLIGCATCRLPFSARVLEGGLIGSAGYGGGRLLTFLVQVVEMVRVYKQSVARQQGHTELVETK